MSNQNGRSQGAVWSPAAAVPVIGATAREPGDRSVEPLPIVSSVMTTNVYAVAPNTSLETAARIMVTRHISGMPVVRDRTPIGVVTLVDLVDPDRARSQGDGYPLYYRIPGAGTPVELGDYMEVRNGRVADVMSPFVLSIEASASLAQAANLMLGEGVHRLLVREGTDLVGIISSSDLLRGFARHFATFERGPGEAPEPETTAEESSAVAADGGGEE